MEKIVPQKLQKGDKIMIIAPSRGLKLIGMDCREIAEHRFREMGLEVVFAPNTTDDNFDEFGSTTIENRVADIMSAFIDKSIKAIFTIIGGFNSNQIISHLDYDVIRQNPKIICGFSDITALLNAIHAKTGLEVYYGPHYSSIGMLKGCEYTIEYLKNILFSDEAFNLKASAEWSDDLWFLDQEKREFIANDGYWIIHDGKAEGKIEGGNLGTFNLLLGTDFRPQFNNDTILFLEDEGGTTITTFDRNLQALCYQKDFVNVKGIVIGRFQKSSEISKELLEKVLNNKPELKNLPLIANVDFGHSTPLITIPLGGYAKINGKEINISK